MALYEPATKRRELSGQLIMFGVWLFVTVTSLALHPDPSGHGTHTQLGLPPCPSVLLFDRPCPGCGLTTSFAAFVHGQFAFAFHAHPLGPLLYLGITVWAWLAIYGWIKMRRLDGSGPAFNRVIAGFAITFFAFGFIRMALDKGYGGAPEQRFASALTANAKSAH